MGYSHFYAEVLRVKFVASEVAAGKNMVIILDELFKGTNVKDAYDATVAVIEAFSIHQNCSFIISTIFWKPVRHCMRSVRISNLLICRLLWKEEFRGTLTA